VLCPRPLWSCPSLPWASTRPRLPAGRRLF
jgi:hypothetical protein